MADTVSVLFVCSGNICRSPTAEGVFRDRVDRAGLGAHVVVDSAGVGGWHVGDPPDRRSSAAAAARGYDLSDQRARQLSAADCAAFDLLVAMDASHVAAIDRLCGAGRAVLMLDFAPGPPGRDVPDPYYGGGQGFELVLDQIEGASDGLLERVRALLDTS